LGNFHNSVKQYFHFTNECLKDHVCVQGLFKVQGGPTDFNLDEKFNKISHSIMQLLYETPNC
jgi:hypothetical protein